MTRVLPVTAEALTGGRPLLVLAPHPDDESLGCGGLLAAAFAGAGAGPASGAHVVAMTDGAASHPGSADWPAPRLAALRRDEMARAVAALGGGGADLSHLDLPDGAMATRDPAPVAAVIAAMVDRLGAATVLAPSAVDAHADHKATARVAALVQAQRPEVRLLTYPVWSRWDEADVVAAHAPARALRLDIGPWRAAKRRAIDCHQSQLGAVVHDDPAGFVLDPRFVDLFMREDELFFEEGSWV
jgi:LmbE family N-acetylglucosaminyl deacetylase